MSVAEVTCIACWWMELRALSMLLCAQHMSLAMKTASPILLTSCPRPGTGIRENGVSAHGVLSVAILRDEDVSRYCGMIARRVDKI